MRHNSVYHKLHHFEVFCYMFWYIHKVVRPRWLSNFRTFAWLQKETPCPSVIIPHCSLTPALCGAACSGHFIKQSHRLCVSWYLVSLLSMVFSEFILLWHVAVLFFFWLNTILLYEYATWWTMDCFHFSLSWIVSLQAFMYKSFCKSLFLIIFGVYLVELPKLCVNIRQPCDSLTVSYQTFPKWLCHFTFPPKMYKVSNSSHPHQHLLLFICINIAIPNDFVKWYFTVALICISISVFIIFSCAYWPFLLIYLLWRNVFRSFLTFLNYLSFYCWVSRILFNVFWIPRPLSDIWLVKLWIFSPVFWVVFSLFW